MLLGDDPPRLEVRGPQSAVHFAKARGGRVATPSSSAQVLRP